MKLCDSPVFVVGGSRSGTSLFAAMLNAHSSIACGSETQILNKINPSKVERIVNDSNWPTLAVKYLAEIELAEQKVIDNFDISNEELSDILKEYKPSIPSLFEAIAGTFAYRQGKQRWAEKTPRHLLHLDTIREAFPNAKIIRLMRDPRDSAISMCQLPWASDNVLVNLYIASDWYNSTCSFFKKDMNSITVSYEDLVTDPQGQLTNVCKFIGEEFELSMLDTSKSASDVSTKNEPWKKQVSGPLDSARLYRWKKELNIGVVKSVTYVAHEWLNDFNYEIGFQPDSVIHLYGFKRTDLESCSDVITDAALDGVALPLATDILYHDKAIVRLTWGRRGREFYRVLKVCLRRFFNGKETGIYAPDIKIFFLRAFGIKVSASFKALLGALK